VIDDRAISSLASDRVGESSINPSRSAPGVFYIIVGRGRYQML
jgi:hypothetical protein